MRQIGVEYSARGGNWVQSASATKDILASSVVGLYWCLVVGGASEPIKSLLLASESSNIFNFPLFLLGNGTCEPAPFLSLAWTFE